MKFFAWNARKNIDLKCSHYRRLIKIMISYEPFYNTLKKKNITTYRLINQYGVSRSLLDRLKNNKPISTVTLNDLCNFLDCNVEDILLYQKDEK